MNNRKRPAIAAVLSLLVSLTVSSCGGGGGDDSGTNVTVPPPVAYTYQAPASNGDTWAVANAGNQGLSVSALEDMMAAINGGSYPNVDAVAIARGGALVFDETIRTRTDSVDNRVNNRNVDMHALYSVSKSITSLIVGTAIRNNYIADVATPYLNLFPYTAYANPDARKFDMTLQDVLTMRLGLDWNEWEPSYEAADNQWVVFRDNAVDYSKELLDLPMIADPGTTFAYNTAASVSLGQAVENSVPMTLMDYASNALFAPLGITDVEVVLTPTGLPEGGGGYFLSARDALKFGQLILNDGQWNGTEIVSSSWLDDSLNAYTPSSWDDPSQWEWQVDGYGYQWWTGEYDINGTQYRSYAAWGYGGQWVVAIPQLDLAVAVFSHAYDDDPAAVNDAHGLIRNHIIAAIQ